MVNSKVKAKDICPPKKQCTFWKNMYKYTHTHTHTHARTHKTLV